MRNLFATLRFCLRYVVLSCIGTFRRPAAGIHILNGHMITRRPGNGENKDREKFKRLLTKLSRHCTFINFDDAVKMIKQQEKVDRPFIAFSFDDGFEDCYTHIAPVLEEFGVNAMMFINPNFVSAGEKADEEYIREFTEITTKSPGKRPLTWAQVRELANRGFLFGAHTLDHSRVSCCNREELKHQIVSCREVMEREIGRECNSFAWPYGRLTDANTEAIKIACNTYENVYSQSDYHHYFSYDGKVINRRHFESWWPVSHLYYFLSCKKS